MVSLGQRKSLSPWLDYNQTKQEVKSRASLEALPISSKADFVQRRNGNMKLSPSFPDRVCYTSAKNSALRDSILALKQSVLEMRHSAPRPLVRVCSSLFDSPPRSNRSYFESSSRSLTFRKRSNSSKRVAYAKSPEVFEFSRDLLEVCKFDENSAVSGIKGGEEVNERSLSGEIMQRKTFTRVNTLIPSASGEILTQGTFYLRVLVNSGKYFTLDSPITEVHLGRWARSGRFRLFLSAAKAASLPSATFITLLTVNAEGVTRYEEDEAEANAILPLQPVTEGGFCSALEEKMGR